MSTERQTKKRAVAKKVVVKKAAARATKASAKLEDRQVPWRLRSVGGREDLPRHAAAA